MPGNQEIFTSQGIRTQFGLVTPPGARVAAYVRSTGLASGDDAYLANNLVATLAQGLAKARAGYGDFVVVLPGHVESVADGTTFSAALVAGTKIVGLGRGSEMPTFTWTATASQWSVTVADVFISGLRLLLDGITAVVSAINVGAGGTDFGFVGNEIEVSTTSKAPTNCITLAAGATRADIRDNYFRGLAASVPTNIIVVAGANTDSNISDNVFICPSVAATGHVSVTGAALGLRVLRNRMYNTAAASTVCVSYAAAASDGIIADNYFGVLNNGTASAQGVTFGAGCLVKAFQNFCTDEPQKSGLLSPVAAT